jgi:hypothetical protein
MIAGRMFVCLQAGKIAVNPQTKTTFEVSQPLVNEWPELGQSGDPEA